MRRSVETSTAWWRTGRTFATRLSLSATTSPTAIVVIGRDGRVTSWNSAAEELFGYTAEEAIGQELDDLVANRPDLHEEGARNTEAALRGERVHEFARRTRKDGSLVDVELLSEQIVAGTEAR